MIIVISMFTYFYFFKIFIFSIIVDLRCSLNFCSTAKGSSHTYVYILLLTLWLSFLTFISLFVFKTEMEFGAENIPAWELYSWCLGLMGAYSLCQFHWFVYLILTWSHWGLYRWGASTGTFPCAELTLAASASKKPTLLQLELILKMWTCFLLNVCQRADLKMAARRLPIIHRTRMHFRTEIDCGQWRLDLLTESHISIPEQFIKIEGDFRGRILLVF